MKKSGSVLVPAVVLTVWALLVWFLGLWLGVGSQLIWYLRGGLWLIGAAGFAGYLVLSSQHDSQGVDSAASEQAAREIDDAFLAASKKLQASQTVKRINSLPAIFLLGDSDSAKTSSLAKSAIGPELLSETPTLKIWYAQQTIFIDPSGSVMNDAAVRKKLFNKFVPVRAGRAASPTRSVVLMVDCELFIKVGSASAILEKSGQYQRILSELAIGMGHDLPVYVLFTKADQIPHFNEYVENLSTSEASEVLGVSLPLPTDESLQANNDLQVERLARAFKAIAWALAERRPLYLAREQSAAKLSDIYEFPREFSKLRPVMVEFMADLCHPGSSSSTSFLRGFYFAGERDHNSIYMPRLFSDVFMSDHAGSASVPRLNSAGASAGLNLAFLAISVAGLLLAAWLSLSFSLNNAMVSEALDDSRPSASESLERLSRMQETLTKLNDFENNGVPWTYRALLYKGEDIRVPLSTRYSEMFRRILLEPTQQTLEKICFNPHAYDAQGYQFVYDALKAYLMTTVHREEIAPAFLTPVLVRHWRNQQVISLERENLARQNFAFYVRQPAQSSVSSPVEKVDAVAVANARAYLNSFEPNERIYREMLIAAAGKEKPIVFNSDYPGSALTVINGFLVEPWFTKAGYLSFQQELKEIDPFISSESWVLGQPGAPLPDKQKLTDILRQRFDSEFIATWTAFIQATTLAHFESVPDAANKLRSLSGVESPLLMNLCVASENTSVAAPKVRQLFQAVQFTAPPGCSRQPVIPIAIPYLGSLNELAIGLTAVGPISQARPDDVRMALSMIRRADKNVKQLTQEFRKAPQDPDSAVLVKTTQLLKEPLTRAEALLNASK